VFLGAFVQVQPHDLNHGVHSCAHVHACVNVTLKRGEGGLATLHPCYSTQRKRDVPPLLTMSWLWAGSPVNLQRARSACSVTWNQLRNSSCFCTCECSAASYCPRCPDAMGSKSRCVPARPREVAKFARKAVCVMSMLRWRALRRELMTVEPGPRRAPGHESILRIAKEPIRQMSRDVGCAFIAVDTSSSPAVLTSSSTMHGSEMSVATAFNPSSTISLCVR